MPGHWGKAGVPLTEDEQRRRQWDRQRSARLKAETREKAHADWRLGRLRPYRITMALDSRALEGPEVDRACKVEEPAVDQWEAGERYPTFEQLEALAELTAYPLNFFFFEHDQTGQNWSSLRFHFADYQPPVWVDKYPRHVIEEGLGA